MISSTTKQVLQRLFIYVMNLGIVYRMGSIVSNQPSLTYDRCSVKLTISHTVLHEYFISVCLATIHQVVQVSMKLITRTISHVLAGLIHINFSFSLVLAGLVKYC